MEGKDRGEFIIPVIIMALSIFLYMDTYTFKFTTYQKANPQMWPRGILILLILVSLILIGKFYFSGEKKNGKPRTNWKSMSGVIMLLFLYIFLMQYLGYIASTLLFTFCAMILFGNRNILQLVVVPILTVAFIFLVFTHAMYIPLPKGIGIFRDFSFMFQ